MTADPLLHPKTRSDLELIINDPPHALVLNGQHGIGKTTVANWLASQLLDVPVAKLANQPVVLCLMPLNNTIGVDAVRRLEHFISLKSASNQSTNRLVVIHDAELMTAEAQNALLKTLEEPPAGTVLLLTTSQPQSLLATVRSRLQTVTIIRPSSDALRTALPSLSAANLALSGGLPGLAFALDAKDSEHQLITAVQTARRLLQSSSFERLAGIDLLAKNRSDTDHLLYILAQMSHAALLSGRNADRWQRIQAAVYQAQEQLNQSVQPKLVLTNLMLGL